MADPKTTTKATAPTAPVTPPVTPATTKPEKKTREKLQEVFPSAEAAVKAAEDRTKGPRRAFKCVDGDGNEYFVVANNEGRAAGAAFMAADGKVEELGKKARQTKPLGVDGFMAALSAMPEAERAAVLAQLKSLK